MFRDEKVGIKMPINGLKTQIVVANACVCEKKVVILQAKLKVPLGANRLWGF